MSDQEQTTKPANQTSGCHRCRDTGWVDLLGGHDEAPCPDCYRGQQAGWCHDCGDKHEAKAPLQCPTCGSADTSLGPLKESAYA